MNRARQELALPAHHDAIAREAASVDRFCSSSIWTVPALEAFRPEAHELFVGSTDRASVALVAAGGQGVGRFLAPLESAWGLASPVVGLTVDDAADALVDVLNRHPAERVAIILGVDIVLATAIARRMQGAARVRLLDRTVRHIASLDGGVDGFLGRRSRKFRAGLRRSRRLVDAAGISFDRYSLERAEDVDAIYPTVVAMEARSWKSLAGNGAARGPMVHFTRGVLQRAASVDRAVLLLARVDGDVVGYIHGALVDGGFRGLQMSFEPELARLSLGNQLQLQMIHWLSELGATRYDLGSQLPYKRRWAEEEFETTGIAIIR